MKKMPWKKRLINKIIKINTLCHIIEYICVCIYTKTFVKTIEILMGLV